MFWNTTSGEIADQWLKTDLVRWLENIVAWKTQIVSPPKKRRYEVGAGLFRGEQPAYTRTGGPHPLGQVVVNGADPKIDGLYAMKGPPHDG